MNNFVSANLKGRDQVRINVVKMIEVGMVKLFLLKLTLPTFKEKRIYIIVPWR